MRINESVALVTGGANGLGLAIAKKLQSQGSRVIVFDRDESGLRALSREMVGELVDVTQPAEVKAAVSDLINRHGMVNVLVNNAGVIYSEPFISVSRPDGIMHDYGRFRDSMEINLYSVFIVTSAVIEQMVMARTKGVVVNISSICACGNEGQTAYSAAKAAVNSMTVTWAKEFGRWGIRCNAVAPGFIGTESTQRAMSESALDYIKKNTPLRRLGRADEVAEAVSSIIANDFINGVILPVDGGLRF